MRGVGVVLGMLVLASASCAAETPAPRPEAPAAELQKLAAAGVGDEVLVAWIEAQPPYAPVAAETIVKLKEGKVGEKVLASFVRNGSQATAERKWAAAAGGEIKELRRYEVPKLTDGPTRNDLLTVADYEQADRLEPSRVVERAVALTYSELSTRYGLTVYNPLTLNAHRYVYPHSWYRPLPYYSHLRPYHFPYRNAYYLGYPSGPACPAPYGPYGALGLRFGTGHRR